MDAQKRRDRGRILFAESCQEFQNEARRFEQEAQDLHARGREAQAAEMVREMYLDLCSFLPRWRMDRWLDGAHKRELAAFCIDRLRDWSPQQAREAQEQAGVYQSSQMARISGETLDGRLNVYWGHDKCDQIDEAMRHGASFTTSNPAKINQFRAAHPEEWTALLAESMGEKGLTAEELFSRTSARVVAMMARHMRPIFDATNGQYGFSSIQVDPTRWDDAPAMTDEILRWYRFFQSGLDMPAPNVTFKVPATPAGVRAAGAAQREYARLRICATSNFSLRQHLEFLDVLSGRNPPGLLVIVDAHLRTYSRPEFEALGLAEPERWCEKLVTEIYRVCYRTLLERGSNVQINGAGIRDWQGVSNNLTANPALATTLTIMPAVIEDAGREPRDLRDRLAEAIPAEERAVLEKSRIFRQAYYPDEFPWEDIYSFEPFAFMMDQFIENYRESVRAIGEVMKEAGY